MNILVVEDEAYVAELICTILEEMGNVCLLSRSADEADRILECRAVDAVTLDLGMFGRGGLEWLDSMAGRDPGLARRTLVITGMQLGADTVLRVTRCGAGLLAKPFSVGGLQEAASSQLGRAA